MRLCPWSLMLADKLVCWGAAGAGAVGAVVGDLACQAGGLLNRDVDVIKDEAGKITATLLMTDARFDRL